MPNKKATIYGAREELQELAYKEWEYQIRLKYPEMFSEYDDAKKYKRLYGNHTCYNCKNNNTTLLSGHILQDFPQNCKWAFQCSCGCIWWIAKTIPNYK